MKKTFLTIMLPFSILVLCSCANNAIMAQNNATNNQNNKDIKTLNVTSDISKNRNLVIYFDYSENIDTAGLTVDAISSASLSNGSTGKNLLNLKVMVDEIKNKKNADVFSIQVNEVYPPMFDDMVGMARTDQNQNKQFTFKNELTNLSDYDTVYFGVPVWRAKLPQPVSVFFEKYDFSGKTIIPFGIHHGSRFGRMIQQMKDYEKDANILDGFTIDADTSNEDVRKEFDKFLEKIN